MSAKQCEFRTGADGAFLRVRLGAYIRKEEEGIYVSYCPALDLYSQGATRQEAREAIIEAVQMFVDGGIEDGTLHEVLTECGFYRYLANEKQPSRGGFSGREFKVPAEIPFMAAA